jgi:hypothetical protein
MAALNQGRSLTVVSARCPVRCLFIGTVVGGWHAIFVHLAQRESEVIPVVTKTNLRRTWKTLAGKPGLPNEISDQLQNHTFQDFS